MVLLVFDISFEYSLLIMLVDLIVLTCSKDIQVSWMTDNTIWDTHMGSMRAGGRGLAHGMDYTMCNGTDS